MGWVGTASAWVLFSALVAMCVAALTHNAFSLTLKNYADRADVELPRRAGPLATITMVAVAGALGAILSLGTLTVTGSEGHWIRPGDWFAAATPLMGVGRAGWLAATIALAVLGARLTVVDARTHRLPDRWVLVAGVAVLAGALAAAASGFAAWSQLFSAAGAALLLGGGTFLLVLAFPRYLGLGDAKVLVPFGLWWGWYGWNSVAAAVLVALLSAGIWAVLLLLTRRARASDHIAYGPFWIVGGSIGAALSAYGTALSL